MPMENRSFRPRAAARRKKRRRLRDIKMKDSIEFRVLLTESQADRLQQRIMSSAMKVHYQEEQHGASLIVFVRCTPSQERTVREILNDIGATIQPITNG